jgi:hypothetical protein
MKPRLKYWLNFIPVVLVVLYLGYSVITMWSNNIVLQAQHYLAIAFMILDVIISIKHHQAGLVLFGFILLLGMFNIRSFDVGVVRHSADVTAARLPIFRGNASCLLLFVIHLVFSFRYYVGILTKPYWKNLMTDFYSSDRQ